ncbi:hypothetical protein BHE74_00035435 [Ensete ventricosum]|uniref:Uncharacterized protein n=1 Tax=Ensete ventricosum TaxID=4639 RepID=A0A427AYS2_ENSVE|nr:hypothetical protein B296_00009841 [Ensete ventricosum]RWW57756.1 hypothetical protein BHE74_00035435 [Ensete ventricosum]RZR70654.1 hypothetical protein BHM03_00001023 [Ensete ventricosum]
MNNVLHGSVLEPMAFRKHREASDGRPTRRNRLTEPQPPRHRGVHTVTADQHLRVDHEIVSCDSEVIQVPSQSRRIYLGFDYGSVVQVQDRDRRRRFLINGGYLRREPYGSGFQLLSK